MADIDLKTETPDTTLPTTGFLFGADSQAAASPSVYSTQTVATTLLGSTSLTGATITTSQPVLDLAQTWNASGVTFTGLRFNAATGSNTGSAAGSLLMDLQLEGTSFFNVRKNGNIRIKGTGVDWVFDGNTQSSELQFIANGVASYAGVNSSGVKALGFSIASVMAATPDTFLTRRAAANLRLGAADTSASATITVTIASPGVVTWSSHGLTTGTSVVFSTTGALPTGITAGTTYYAIVVDANTFQLATSFANALAGTAVNTSGSQSGTHTGRRGAIAQQFGPQDTLSTGSLENIDGADFVIRGSRSIGNKPGGSIIFQVAPPGSSGTAQNALATAMTINSAGLLSVTPSSSSATSIQVLRGSVNTPAYSFSTDTSSGAFFGALNGLNTYQISVQGNLQWAVGQSGGGTVQLGPVSWAAISGSSLGSPDVLLFRDAANTLALRNGTNNQVFRVYNTFTSATDFERANIFWDSNVLKIGTEKGSAGGTARALEFQTDGATRMSIAANGSAINISPSGNTWLQVTAAKWAFQGTGGWNNGNGNTIASAGPFTGVTNRAADPLILVCEGGSGDASSGSIQFRAAPPTTSGTSGHVDEEAMRIAVPVTGTPIVSFGGTTSSFPALKRSSASLQVRLADDSANAALESASIKTDAPTGGTAATWKLGTVATVSPTSPNRTIEVEIGGTTYYISAKTTND